MAGFEYQALDATGRTVKGVLKRCERHVRAALRDKGLTPLRVDASTPAPRQTRNSAVQPCAGACRAATSPCSPPVCHPGRRRPDIEEWLRRDRRTGRVGRTRAIVAGYASPA